MLISMTQGGDPRDNAIAERVNGILKTEWLNQNHYAGLEDAIARVSQVIYTYNHRRAHLSLDYKTPVQAYEDRSEQKRVWKNYYKANKPEDVASVIADLTSGCRTTAQI